MKMRRSEDVLQSEVEAGLALLDPKSNTYFLLNRTGSLVWAELEEPKSLDQLCDAISESFDVSVSQCKSDVESLLSALTEKGLVLSSRDSAD